MKERTKTQRKSTIRTKKFTQDNKTNLLSRKPQCRRRWRSVQAQKRSSSTPIHPESSKNHHRANYRTTLVKTWQKWKMCMVARSSHKLSKSVVSTQQARIKSRIKTKQKASKKRRSSLTSLRSQWWVLLSNYQHPSNHSILSKVVSDPLPLTRLHWTIIKSIPQCGSP